MRNPLVFICSVDLELSPLLPFLSDRTPYSVGPACTGWAGTLHDWPVLAIAGGIGKANAAHSLTLVLHGAEAAAVIGFGVGGAYHGSGLAVGDVTVADREIYGDEGVETPDGWLSCEGIGIPTVQTTSTRLFNEFVCDARGTQAALAALRGSDRTVRSGNFVTVSCCSGTSARGEQLAGRFQAICETMEGASYAHIAAIYAVPFIEVRGISNLVEDRDLKSWKLRQAADAAARAAVAAAVAWNDIRADGMTGRFGRGETK